jgi:transposase-like protein
MARKHYDPETRAAVMAALLEGQGVNQVAEAYKLPHATVSRWKKQARAEAGRSEDIGELLLGYLSENLTTLRVQVRLFREERFLSRGGPEQWAILHGVLTDKAVRLLEALDGSGVTRSDG